MLLPIKYYTGIGSRKTPQDVLDEMRTIAFILQENGYWLRSGGAPGADTAFEEGAGDQKEIFLPWNKFNDRTDGLVMGRNRVARDIAKTVIDPDHWYNLSPAAEKLHTRNVPQVLGKDLKTPSEFVVCYTEKGLIKGGTATALKLAQKANIEIFNLAVCKFPIDRFL